MYARFTSLGDDALAPRGAITPAPTETAAAITGKDENRFESLDAAFFRRVYNQYRAIAQREPSRVVAIEGDAGVEAVHRRILSVVEERLTQHRAS